MTLRGKLLLLSLSILALPWAGWQFVQQLEVLLLTGIANIEPLKEHILSNSYTYERVTFSDHHIFSIDDLREIEKRFTQLEHNEKLLLTTEKDATRLALYRDLFELKKINN